MRSHSYRQIISDRAFTLLEVMIAVSIIAIALVTLLGSQSRSLSHATEAQFNTIAPMLASLKLAEVESKVIPATNDEGEFGEDFSAYRWKVDVEDAQFESPEALAEIKKPMQKITLTVWWDETPYSYILTYYGSLLN